MTPRLPSSENPFSTSRVEAFSDSVIAVAITLLVLDVKLPAGLMDNAAIWAALAHLTPVLLAWVVSFAFLLTIWVNHHQFMTSLTGVDRGMVWLNGLFLLSVSLIPFPTGLVGQYPGMTAPLALLSIVMMFASSSFAAMRLYATFHAGLLKSHISPKRAGEAAWRSAMAPLYYAGAAGLAFLWPPGAIAVQVLVLAMFIMRPPGRHIESAVLPEKEA